MKNVEELENMTYRDITTNEGARTNFILGTGMLILSVLYLFLSIYAIVKRKVRMIRYEIMRMTK